MALIGAATVRERLLRGRNARPTNSLAILYNEIFQSEPYSFREEEHSWLRSVSAF